MYSEYKRERPALGKVETLFQSIHSLTFTASGIVSNSSVPYSKFHQLADDVRVR